MAERSECRIGAPVALGALRLLPLVRLRLQVQVWVRAGAGFCALAASQEPEAVVVRSAQGLQAFDAAGAPVALDALRARVAGLDRALEALGAP